jgi:hypothetical protein
MLVLYLVTADRKKVNHSKYQSIYLLIFLLVFVYVGQLRLNVFMLFFCLFK